MRPGCSARANGANAMQVTGRNLLASASIATLIALAATPAGVALAQPPETTTDAEHEDVAEPGEIVTAEDVTVWTAEDHATAADQAPTDGGEVASAAAADTATGGGGAAGGAGGGGAAPAAAAGATPETAPLGSSGTGGTGGNGRPVQDPDKPR